MRLPLSALGIALVAAVALVIALRPSTVQSPTTTTAPAPSPPLDDARQPAPPPPTVAPTAAPLAATTTPLDADAAWTALQPPLDAAWGSDWVRVTALLDAFRAQHPTHEPARAKLYAALVAHGHQRLSDGGRTEGIALLERARGLLPGRGEAEQLLFALTPAARPPSAVPPLSTAPAIQPTQPTQPTPAPPAPTAIPVSAPAPATAAPATAAPATTPQPTGEAPTPLATVSLSPPTAPPTPQPTVAPTVPPTAARVGVTAPLVCTQPLQGGFGKLWRENVAIQARLGCPRERERAVAAVDQRFERGMMYWEQDTRQIVVLVPDAQRDPGLTLGRWQDYPDLFREGDAEPTLALVPPPGRLAPRHGFGKVWFERPGVRDQLGWAVAGERLFQGAVQEFDYGRMLWPGEGVRLIFVLYTADATYFRFVAPPGWDP